MLMLHVLQGGVTYISQVLKRNRTLRVLNLSDNKIESTGLVALSEALVSCTSVTEYVSREAYTTYFSEI